ncbi:MAG: OmpA family protein [Paludibacteraceae bacterium]|nr:OmpA family protein [Paludibacteraceae bacterium]
MNKRLFSILAAAALTLSVSAQQSAHDNYLGVSFGGGMNTMLYKPANGTQSLGGGIDAGLFYGRFFNQTVGLGVGLQYTWANASAFYNYNEVSTGLTHPNNPNTLYNLNTTYTDWRERQTVGVLSIPVEVLFRKGLSDRWAFIGGVGLSLDFPLHGTYSPLGGTYATTGVFPKLGSYTVSNLPEHGFDTYTTTQGGKITNLAKVGASAIADLGFRCAFNDNWGMYMGVYAGYGFTNLLAEAKTTPMVIINEKQQIDYSGTFASDETSKANLLRLGVKVAIDFGWPKAEKVVEAPVEEQLPTIDEEAERLAREAAEREAAEKAAHEAAAKAEQERIAAEKAAREKAEAGRLAREKAEKEAAWNAFKNRIDGINVYFENSKTVPAISDEDKAAIDELCAFLKDNKEYKVVVIGHTDSYGDPEQNLNIWGMQRAEALRDYMVKQGAPAEQIRCESKGQTEPIAPNDSRANRALNRRANIRFE